MNLAKLSPAPWSWHQNPRTGEDYYEGPLGEIHDALGKVVCEFGNSTMYYPSAGQPPSEDDLASMLLGRAALDVQMRRRWGTICYVDGTWGVQNSDTTFPKGLGGQSWPNPVTALVEADSWYREHIEQAHLP